MVDDLGFQPTAQQPADDLGFQPVPKMPDMSGVQRMAQDNLAANDNKETDEVKPPQTPAERLNTAIGHPVQSLLNPDDNIPIPGNARRELTRAYANSSATDAGDFWQSALHSLGRIAESARAGIGQGYEAGTLVSPIVEHPAGIGGTAANLLSTAANIPVQGMFAGYSAFQAIAQQTGSELGQPAAGRDIALFPEAMIGAEGMQPHVPNVLREPIGKIVGKEPSAVTLADMDQVVAQGTKTKQPAAQDFHNVATYIGLPEKMLDTVYDVTGKTPENVLVDSQQNPSIVKDIANDEIPKAYEPFIEQRELPHEQLQVARSDGDKVFNVVDRDGDYVSGGFNSSEEASHYIEDEKFKLEERKAIEEDGNPPAAETKPSKNTEAENSNFTSSQKRYANKNQEERAGVRSAAIAQLKDLEEQVRPYEDGTYKDLSEEEIEQRDELRKRANNTKKTIKDYDVVEEHEKNNSPVTTEKTEAGEQTVIPGAEKISEKNLAERIMEKLLGAKVEQKPANEGLFDTGAQKQQDIFNQPAKAAVSEKPKSLTVSPSEIGKPTNLRTFLLNNGAKLDETGQLSFMKGGLDNATELAQQYGYFTERPSIPELQNKLLETNGGREHTRPQDIERVLKMQAAQKARENIDPTKVEHQAHNVGIDTEKLAGETDKQHTARLIDSLKRFYQEEAGSGITLRKMIGDTINIAEKFAGVLSGGMFEKLADGYIKTFQPELAGDLARRADAYLAKFKAAGQEAVNAYIRQSADAKKAFDRLTPNERLEWLYDHETGRWNEEENPDHARQQAMYDAIKKAETDAGVGSVAYKENYLPHQWEKPEEVSKFFRSEAMIKKFGRDWFNKASEFRLVQEGIRAGFKLKTDNPESMLVSRQLASQNLISTMDLLKDFESSGIATKATGFSIDKRITKTQDAITELQTKYKKEFEKKNNPNQPALVEGLPPAESKVMKLVEGRLSDLKERLDNLTKEKEANKLTPEQMKDLKEGYRIIGPDNKVWNLHQQSVPIWKNAMEMKGLYENQGLAGNLYRPYMAMKAVYVRTKMLASMWHPTHEVVIDVSSDIASAAHHLIQGGKISDLIDKSMIPNVGLGKYTAKLQDNPQMQAWNTPHEARTPQQTADVQRMVEGGFVPTVPRQDAVNFKDNFNKAISGVGKNNLRLIGTALELPSLPMAPLMEHWIPGMKTESYFQRTELALKRDPSLAQDAGRRSEAFRQIAQDIERNYGEMNRQTQFWNPVVRDTFNAVTFSGGWKLAMLQNFRGLLEPAKIAYDFAKNGEFSKEAITHQMLQSYIYTANMMMLGAGLNYLFTGVVGTIKDWINPQTGDKNPDGTPVRLRQPAFFNEPLMLMHDINQDGVVAGTGTFLYHQSQIPSIGDTLLGRDYVQRPYITDPTDLQQWKNMGWDSVNPITMTNVARAEEKGSKTAAAMGWLGFPIAGSWVNQSPFEQKIIAAYDRMHPSEGGAYEAKLKSEMKGAVQSKDTNAQADIAAKMKAEGLTDEQISHSKQPFKTPFAEFAWKKLSMEDQKRLIGSASDEEKKKYRVRD